MVRTFCVNLVLFLGAAWPLCWFLSELDRYPPVLRDKLAYYRAHHDEFDTLVVGSSYTYFGLNPRVLDAKLAEHGIESSTFSLAAYGLNGHEIDETLRLALKADKNRRLKRIIVDLRPLEAWDHVLFGETEHAVWWHSPRQTVAALITLRKSRRSSSEKLKHSIRHLALLIENHLPLGTALNLRRERLRDLSTDWFWQSLSEYRGYEPLTATGTSASFAQGRTNASWEMLMQRDRMLSHPQMTEDLLIDLVERNDEAGDLEVENVDFWLAQTGELRRRGILGIHLAMPAFTNPSVPTGMALREQGALENFLSFGDPREHPELFDIENRFEFGHLNDTGSVLFSRLLGEEVAGLLNGLPVPAQPGPVQTE